MFNSAQHVVRWTCITHICLACRRQALIASRQQRANSSDASISKTNNSTSSVQTPPSLNDAKNASKRVSKARSSNKNSNSASGDQTSPSKQNAQVGSKRALKPASELPNSGKTDSPTSTDQASPSLHTSKSASKRASKPRISSAATTTAGQSEQDGTQVKQLGDRDKEGSVIRKIEHKREARNVIRQLEPKGTGRTIRAIRYVVPPAVRKVAGNSLAGVRESVPKGYKLRRLYVPDRAKLATGATRGRGRGRIRATITVTRSPSIPTTPEKVWNSTIEKNASKLSMIQHDTCSINGREQPIPIDVLQPPIPRLAHGLDRVLFNPGIYQLQDPHSAVFNFDPYLQKIMPLQEFDFTALAEYKTSSEDDALSSLARARGRKYVGSTSSMTGVLSQFHYLLSCHREINVNMLSRSLEIESTRFTKIARAPQAIFLRWQDGTYAIDADKEFNTPNILMLLGKSMEKLMTMSKNDFERFRRSNPSPTEKQGVEPYQYTEHGDLLMRSQLDTFDPRLPRNGTFDLKTRSVKSIRMDTDSEESRGYELMSVQGNYMSFEREYYDMLRSTMLKYMLQARMGRMEGIFVAYHNIERIFGFQYISLSEIDHALHDEVTCDLGDQEFSMSLTMLNDVLNKATTKFPEQSLRIMFETQGSVKTAVCALRVFAEPVTEDEIEAIQSVSNRATEEFEKKILAYNESDASDLQMDSVSADAELHTASDQTLPTSQKLKQDVEKPGSIVEEALAPPNGQDAAVTFENLDAVADAANVDMAVDVSPTADVHIDSDTIDTPSASVERNPAADVHIDSETVDTPSTTLAAMDVDDSNTHEDIDDSIKNTDQEVVEESNAADAAVRAQDSADTKKPLFAATVLVDSQVNGQPVIRPQALGKDKHWTVKYKILEYPDSQHDSAWKLYEQVKKRRRKMMLAGKEDVSEEDSVTPKEADSYSQMLRMFAKQGRQYRRLKDEKDKDKPVQMYMP